jgi:hypothetical protein
VNLTDYSDCSFLCFDTNFLEEYAASIFWVEGIGSKLRLQWSGWGCGSVLQPRCKEYDQSEPWEEDRYTDYIMEE